MQAFNLQQHQRGGSLLVLSWVILSSVPINLQHQILLSVAQVQGFNLEHIDSFAVAHLQQQRNLQHLSQNYCCRQFLFDLESDLMCTLGQNKLDLETPFIDVKMF